MKVKIDENGKMVFYVASFTEKYAIEQWAKEHCAAGHAVDYVVVELELIM